MDTNYLAPTLILQRFWNSIGIGSVININNIIVATNRNGVKTGSIYTYMNKLVGLGHANRTSDKPVGYQKVSNDSRNLTYIKQRSSNGACENFWNNELNKDEEITSLQMLNFLNPKPCKSTISKFLSLCVVNGSAIQRPKTNNRYRSYIKVKNVGNGTGEKKPTKPHSTMIISKNLEAHDAICGLQDRLLKTERTYIKFYKENNDLKEEIQKLKLQAASEDLVENNTKLEEKLSKIVTEYTTLFNEHDDLKKYVQKQQGIDV